MAYLHLHPRRTAARLVVTASLLPNANPYAQVWESGVGVTNSNTYVTVDQARAYFVGRRLFSSTWTTTDSDNQLIALKQASALLDAEFTWVGNGPLTTTQGLAWPRLDPIDKDGVELVGVPKAVRDATCEVALFLLGEDRLTGRSGVGISRLKVDVIDITFDKTETPETFPSHVARMLKLVGAPVRGSGQIRTVKLSRV